ncbi:hypothetical protein ACFQW6_07345 [Nocardioides sp. GCM10028917]|uniref:hypothetical protein n=1 Tax=Nocardioides sp. GCM10028917 TaxID=3273408 RepID=UPI00360790E6
MKDDVELREVALHNDRSQYELVLAEKIKKFLSSVTTPTARSSTSSSPTRTSRP